MDSDFIAEANKSLWNYYKDRKRVVVDDIRAKLGKWDFTPAITGEVPRLPRNPDRAYKFQMGLGVLLSEISGMVYGRLSGKAPQIKANTLHI
jgi:hypothetical protein